MTEPQDPQLSQHYRDLEPLEPPGELDRAILAAGRRASPRRRRWCYSLAAAAVLVFAVALTVHIERERPDSESASQDGAAHLRLSRELRGEIKPADPRAESKPAKVAPPAVADAATPASPPPDSRMASARPTRRADAVSARQSSTAEASASSPSEPPIELRRETAIGSQYAATPPAARSAAPAAARESPEKWLERIAEMRSRGRHAEADKELAEFRRAYPNFALSDVMRERVEGR